MEQIGKIIETACSITGISLEEFNTKRTVSAVYARTLIYQYYMDKGLKHYEIAKIVGKSRSTVTYHLSRFAMMCKYDKDFKRIYDRFEQEVRNYK